VYKNEREIIFIHLPATVSKEGGVLTEA